MVVGGRVQLLRLLARSLYVELYGGSESREDSGGTDGRSYESEISWRRIVGSAGAIATFLHPGDNRLLSANAVLGVGFLSEVSRDMHLYSSQYGSDGYDIRTNRLDPLLNVAIEAETAFSPAVKGRAGMSFLVGFDLANRGEGFLWYPGVTLSAGIGVSI